MDRTENILAPLDKQSLMSLVYSLILYRYLPEKAEDIVTMCRCLFKGATLASQNRVI